MAGAGAARMSKHRAGINRPLLVIALAIPAVYVAFALSNRSKGIEEGKKASQYPQMGSFGHHPPVERSGGGI